MIDKSIYNINKKNTVLLFLCLIIQVITGFLILNYFFTNSNNTLLIATFTLWISIFLYSIIKIHERIILFFLQITIFTFILSRPLIDFFNGKDWIKNTYNYSQHANAKITIIALFISLSGIYLGSFLANLIKTKRVIKNNTSNQYLYILRKISFIVFVISFLFDTTRGIEKIIFRFNHSYEQYYSLFKSHLPYIVYIISSFNKYSLCFFLATKPEKRVSTLLLFLNIILTLPELILGSRGDFILSLFFALFYYIYRDYCGSTEKWIGKHEKRIIFISIPCGITFLSFFNYIREGIKITNTSLINLIIDFFYKQGVTFSWISCGMGIHQRLPKHINYSFGAIIDYIFHGSLGQILFQNKEIPSGNNIIHATTGNSLSHHLSYAILGNHYLSGHGTGSSYLLENYIDFGYGGVFIISVLIGLIIVYSINLSKKYYSITVLIFLMFSNIIYMPRNEFGQIFGFLTYIQFWFILICCLMGSLLLKQKYKKYF